jgi:hypothetical protein
METMRKLCICTATSLDIWSYWQFLMWPFLTKYIEAFHNAAEGNPYCLFVCLFVCLLFREIISQHIETHIHGDQKKGNLHVLLYKFSSYRSISTKFSADLYDM